MIETCNRTPLPLDFYAQETREVAKALLGTILVHEGEDGVAAGVIVETEAYLFDDPASHSFSGERPRNKTMFGAAGRAYVYLSYGINEMLNVVTSPAGMGEAVLIRAAYPIEGIELMRCRRGQPDLPAHLLASGPGKLTRAFGINRSRNNGAHLSDASSNLWIAKNQHEPVSEIVVATRIGITRAVDKPWRYYVAGNLAVSRK